MYVAEVYILTCGYRILAEVLEYDSEHFVQIFHVVLAYVCSVEKYHAVSRVVKSRQKLDKCGLSRTVQADKHSSLARAEFYIDVMQNIVLCSGVSKAHMHKFYRMRFAVADFFGLVVAVYQPWYDGCLFLHKGYEVVYEQRALVYCCRCAYKRAEASRYTCNRSRVKRIVSYQYHAVEHLYSYEDVQNKV